MSEDEQRYRLLWSIEPRPEGVAKSELPEGVGACDALLVASILYPPEGGFSVMFLGGDGRTGGGLAFGEWVKVWTMLTAQVAESEGPMRAVAQDALRSIRSIVGART